MSRTAASENQVYLEIPRAEGEGRCVSNPDVTSHEISVTYISSKNWPLDHAMCGSYDSHYFCVKYRRFEWFIDKCADDCVLLNEQIANIYPSKEIRTMRRSCIQKYFCFTKRMGGEEMADYFQSILSDRELYMFRFVRMCFEISEVRM